MSMGRSYNRELRSSMHLHAVWPPIVEDVRLGDYGVWRQGVFRRVGNIGELGVSYNQRRGKTIEGFSLASTSTTQTYFTASGKIDALPAGSVDAELRIEFTRDQGFYVRSGTLQSRSIANIPAVAAALNQRSGWWPFYKVVSSLYEATSLTFFGAREKGAAVSLNGSAEALRAFEGDAATAGVSVSSKKQLEFSFFGKSGPVGLGLFRVRWLTSGPVSFSDDDEASDEPLYVLEESWDAKLDDDAEPAS